MEVISANLLELLERSALDALELVLAHVDVAYVGCVLHELFVHVRDLVPREREHGQASQIAQLMTSELLDLSICE